MTDDPASPTLARFRAEIDALDDQLFALLFARARIVEKVAEYKRAQEPGTANLRPGREADMVRRVYETFRTEKFSPEAAASLWRLIISGSLGIETNFSVSVYATEADSTCYWLAREYFGAFTPITRQSTTNRVIGDVMDGKAKVGVMPMPQGEGVGQWWQTLLDMGKSPAKLAAASRMGEASERRTGMYKEVHEDSSTEATNQTAAAVEFGGRLEVWPKIFAVIPFIQDEKTSKHSALAIGKVVPEPTGDDISYLTLTTQGDVSTHRLQTAFTKAGMNATWVNVLTVGKDLRHHLVQVREFLQEDHPKLKNFIADMGESAIQVLLLGAYATPITPANIKPTEQSKTNDKTANIASATHSAGA